MALAGRVCQRGALQGLLPIGKLVKDLVRLFS